MKYGQLGRSGLLVSRLCLGGNSWGAKGRRGWGAFDSEEARGFFAKALELGINFFDTADAYNQGRSEEVIGETLLKMAHRDDVVIGTKFGWPTIDRPNHRGSGRKNLMKALDASLKRLQTDYIDLYQIHHYDPLTPIDEVSWSLEEAVRSGKVRYIGVSNMPAYKFAQMIMLADWRGRSRPIAMQNLYNLIQREQERDVNRLCAEEGIGLIPYSPLARGFLSGTRAREGGGTTERSRNDTVVKAGTYRDCDWEIIERLKRIATARGTTPAQIALAWLLSKSYMAAPIVGATSLEQLESSAKATEIALGSDEIRQLEEPYQFRVQTPE